MPLRTTNNLFGPTDFCGKSGIFPMLETWFLFRFRWNFVGVCSIVVTWSLLNADSHEWPPVPLDWFLLKNGVLPTLETLFLFGFPWISVGMCLIVVAWSLLDANMHEWPPVPLDWFLSYKSFWGILFIKSFKSKGYGARSTTTSLRGVPRHSRLYFIFTSFISPSSTW